MPLSALIVMEKIKRKEWKQVNSKVCEKPFISVSNCLIGLNLNYYEVVKGISKNF